MSQPVTKPVPAPAPLHANLILLLSVGAAGFTAIFARVADAPGLVVATWRVIIAAAVLTVPFLRQPPELRRLDPALLRWGVGGGVLFALALGTFHLALETTTAANATFLDSIAPLWVGLLTLFVLKRALPRLFWPGVAVALSGAALIMFAEGGATRIRPGDVIILGETVIWAAYLIVAGEGRARFSTLTWAWLTLAVSVVVLTALSLLAGLPLAGYSAPTAAAILGSGLVSQVGAFTGINYVLGHLPAARVSVAFLLQPVVSAVAAFFLLGEVFGDLRLAGGALILAGMYLVNRE